MRGRGESARPVERAQLNRLELLPDRDKVQRSQRREEQKREQPRGAEGAVVAGGGADGDGDGQAEVVRQDLQADTDTGVVLRSCAGCCARRCAGCRARLSVCSGAPSRAAGALRCAAAQAGLLLQRISG